MLCYDDVWCTIQYNTIQHYRMKHMTQKWRWGEGKVKYDNCYKWFCSIFCYLKSMSTVIDKVR